MLHWIIYNVYICVLKDRYKNSHSNIFHNIKVGISSNVHQQYAVMACSHSAGL